MYNILVFVVALLLPLGGNAFERFHGYQVIRVYPDTAEQLKSVWDLIDEDKYDFWKKAHSPGDFGDVMLSPQENLEVTAYFRKENIRYSVMIDNLEGLVENERKQNSLRRRAMDWEDYHTWDEITTWLANLVAGSSNSSEATISSEIYGSSLEGRPLQVYRISSGGSGKPAFWIDATIHAREHITTAVITYIINQLVTNSTNYSDILNQVDFYFAPFINPDGYAYTHEVNRMWRKTRSNWTNSTCIGVDANRNFGYHWGNSNGSSSSPCSESYHGPESFSEPEARSVRDYILERNASWTAYISLHSYSQYWLAPWAYTNDVPDNFQENLELAQEAAAELKKHFNTTYTVGSASSVMYAMSGCSQDWARGEGGFRYSYTVELRDTGRYGFLLPREQIIPTAIETWAGIQVIAQNIARNIIPQ